MTGDIDLRGGISHVTDSGEMSDDVLAQWDPQTSVNVRTARVQTRHAGDWLRQNGRQRTRVDFIAALADNSTLRNELWWDEAVHVGPHRFVDSGLVEYRSETQEYRWIRE